MKKTLTNYQLNQSAYNQLSPDYYHQNWGDSWKNDLSLINKFIELLSGKEVVDVGAGTGGIVSYFQDKNLKPTYVDFSDTFIDFVERKLSNINIVNADIRQLPFKDQSFDGVFTRYCLQHILLTDYPKAIAGLIRITKIGGYIYLCTHIREDQDSKTSIFRWSNQNIISRKNLLTSSQLINLVPKSKAKIIDQQIHHKNNKVTGITLIIQRYK